MNATDIVSYTFRADIYCPFCIIPEVEKYLDFSGEAGRDTEDLLDELSGNIGIDRGAEDTFDSGDFPKVVFAVDCHEPYDHCGRCGEPLI